MFEKLFRIAGYIKEARMIEIFKGDNRFISPFYSQGDAPKNFEKNITAYKNEVWIYACVYLIATTIAGLPWRLYKEKSVKGIISKEEVDNPDVRKLFRKPNNNDANSTWFSMIEWTVANLELIGNAFWLLDEMYGSPKKPLSIQVLLAPKMRVVPGITSGMMVDRYEYHTQDLKPKKFEKEEITHFKYMAVDNYHYGQGSLSPALYSIDTIKEAQIANLKIFKNGMMIDAFFKTDQKLTEATYTRMKKQLDAKYKGSPKSHQTGLLEQGLEYQAITGNMKELEFINGIKLSREDICAVHGVPPLLVGILDQASYSNYEQAIKIFMVFCILPKLARIEQVITSVVKRFDKNLFFEFDVSNIDALKADEKIRSEIAKNYFSMGVPANTIIDKLKLPFGKIPGGDVGFLPINLIPASMAAEGKPDPVAPAPPAVEGEEGKGIRPFYNKERKLFLWKQFNRIAEKIEITYMKIIETFFLGLEIGILRRLESSKSLNAFIGKEEEEEKPEEINVETTVFDKGKEIKNWSKQSRKVHDVSMKTNGNRELVNLGLGSTFDVSNPAVVRFLDQYGLEKATEVIGSAARDVKATLIAGVENGEGLPELKKRIQAEFKPYTDQGYKAQRIARTEVIGSSNQGALEAYKQANVGATKAWLNEPDARDNHLLAGRDYDERKAIPLDQDFYVGADQMAAPGGGGLPEENINCRCSLIPVIKT